MIVVIALLIEFMYVFGDILIWISHKLSVANVIAILTLIAIFLGPYFTLRISQNSDRSREQEGRRWDIFCTLMRYREQQQSSEFVGALNVIEAEFNNYDSVISAWQNYLNHISLELESKDTNHHFEERDSLREKLLLEIAKTFNIKIDHLSIASGYSPSGWKEKEDQEEYERGLTLSVLEGSTPISVILDDNSSENLVDIESPKEVNIMNKENKYGRERYTDELKLMVISRIVRGERVSSVARDVRIPVGKLMQWYGSMVTVSKRMLRKTGKPKRIEY